MENSISWTNYWILVGTALVLYYAGVLIIYFRNDFFKLRVSKANRTSARGAHSTLTEIAGTARTPASDGFDSMDSGDKNEPDIVALIQAFTSELVAYLEQAGKDHTERQEILFSVNRLIKKYSANNLISYQPAINQLLMAECEVSCSIRLEEQEIKRVWKG